MNLPHLLTAFLEEGDFWLTSLNNNVEILDIVFFELK
jgi:hypothetical protein